MNIKKICKSNKNSDKIYTYYRLVESYRTPNGPRHRTILNLGKLDIPESKFKLLADRIEEIVTGQESLFSVSPTIETLSQYYADEIIKKDIKLKSQREKKLKAKEHVNIDPNSTKIEENRSIGGEHITLSTIKQLKFDKYLKSIGFSEKQINATLLSIIGRLLYPKSEKRTLEWGQNVSGLGELLGADFNRYGKNILYRVSDKLYEHKREIEKYLSKKARNLFSLEETIILYDLTNTFFEGGIRKSELKRRGRSKEKRSDAPLVTLGLILDENGFPKASKIFKGNVSEAKTLRIMLDELKSTMDISKKPTVVMDAGISTKENLKMIREEYRYDYIVVSRQKLDLYNGENLITIKEDKKKKKEIEAYLYKGNEESVLYCKSKKRLLKEEMMENNLKKSFEKDLEQAKSSLKKKNGTKKYEKVIERIGRIKGRHSKVSRFYTINIISKDKKIVTDISYEILDDTKIKKRFSGSYYLRTSRADLKEKEIWNIYIMLTDVEASFKGMKSELGFRPVRHQTDLRIEAHLFITVIAYHIEKIIRYKLKKQDIIDSWDTIRFFMRTHEISTVTQEIKDGGRLYIRKCSEPERYQRKIYEALEIKDRPINGVILVKTPKKKSKNL